MGLVRRLAGLLLKTSHARPDIQRILNVVHPSAPPEIAALRERAATNRGELSSSVEAALARWSTRNKK